MKIIKILAVLLFSIFLLAQLYRPGRENPAIDAVQTLEASMLVPENVSQILKRSCGDCHSNQTNWVWYSNIAPASWFIADHVNHGRRHLNLSIWRTYDARQQEKRLDEVCEQISEREMPLSSYLYLHSEAIMSDEEISAICAWSKAEAEKIAQANPEN